MVFMSWRGKGVGVSFGVEGCEVSGREGGGRSLGGVGRVGGGEKGGRSNCDQVVLRF